MPTNLGNTYCPAINPKHCHWLMPWP